MYEVFNYGGGRQTVAIALLIVQGRLPRPDCIVIADTGREAQSTWDYLDQYIRPRLAEVGLAVEIAPHSLSKVDLYAHNGDLLLPSFTGDHGKLNTFCSREWKALVVARYLSGKGITPKSRRHWLGFAFNEQARIRRAMKDPQAKYFPLFDLCMTTALCIQMIHNAGLPIPQKSSCYMCPHRSDEQWRFIRDNYPEQWADAIRIDNDTREEQVFRGQPPVYLHHSRTPLEHANLDGSGVEQQGFASMCASGNCFT